MTTASPPQTEINSVIALYSNGQIKEALDAIKTLTKSYPNDPILYNISGACYAGLGQLDVAVKNYEKSLTIKPDYAEAHNNLAGTLQELGQLNAAVKSYEKALTIKPDYAEAHNNLGNTLKELGQLDSAITSYQKAIAIKPNYVEAHYSLGTAFQELGQLDTAVKNYEQVLTINPDLVEAHNNLGFTLQELGQLNAAVKSYEKALAIRPNYAEAHNNLGNALYDLGQLNAAVKSYEKALAIKPDFADTHNNLGIALKELKQLDAALKSYEKAIAIKPDHVEAHNNRGNVLSDLGQLDAAVKSFETTLTIKPDYAEVHNNLGLALMELGQLDAAIRSFERTLAIKPDYADAYNNLGLTLMELGQLDAALKSYEKAIAIKPDHVEAHNNLGNALNDLGQLDASIKSFEKAFAIKPDFPEVHNNLGLALMELGQLDAAIKCFEKALAIKPDYAEGHNNLGLTLMELGQLDEALVSFERAIDLKPDIDFALGNFLHTKMHLCIWDDLPNDLNELTIKINNNEKVIEPFSMLALIDDPEIQWKTAKISSKEKYPKSHFLSKIERYTKHKKIRIGYFSADFKEHPVATLTAKLYETHDRGQFEIHAFSYGPDTNDKMNLRIKAGVDHFHEVRRMTYADTTMLARSLEIDIAVDLGGYTANCRTEIFAMQVAPIQVNYLGYSGTMGADYMDYLIADHTLISKDKQVYYSENITYLPYSFMVNDTKNKVSKRIFTRTEVGLPNNGFVFCCFNNHFKITPSTFIRWMRILSKVDGSVLWLPEGNITANNNLKKEAIKNSVDENRIIFSSRLTLREDHLNRIQLADLFLDTTPYNAHATTSDALRMGLPVLTCIGHSFASRVAASLLNAVNLPELITTNQEQYESLAIELATHPEKLKIIKDKLVSNLLTAPLYDTKLFTKNLESAYTMMYDRYQRDLDPDHIYVKH